MHTNTQTLTPGVEIELAGRNAVPCVCNRSGLGIVGHCESEWSGEAATAGESCPYQQIWLQRGECVCVGVWRWVLCGSSGWLISWGMRVCMLMIANKWAWAIFFSVCQKQKKKTKKKCFVHSKIILPSLTLTYRSFWGFFQSYAPACVCPVVLITVQFPLPLFAGCVFHSGCHCFSPSVIFILVFCRLLI